MSRGFPMKSVRVDYPTWLALQYWSSEESRSVAGQIRYLVEQEMPEDVRQQVTKELGNGDRNKDTGLLDK